MILDDLNKIKGKQKENQNEKTILRISEERKKETKNSIRDREEFIEQVKMHSELMQNEFGVKPKVFRNR